MVETEHKQAGEGGEVTRGRSVAEGCCPEPGCPEQLQLDPDSPNILRCQMHGPMAFKDGFDAVAEELAARRSITLEEARAAIIGPGRGGTERTS